MIINKAKLLAAKRGLSIYRVAKDAKLSYPAVYNFFHDVSRRYDKRVLDRLCQVLACQVSDLLEHIPNSQESLPAGRVRERTARSRKHAKAQQSTRAKRSSE
ncbi:MAG: helix-turn-helix transcriptional regulator [Acidobacteriota bacterium]